MSNVLIMPFLDKGESFTNGFECGQIWNKIEEGEVLEGYLIHTENIEQIKLICRTFGVECGIEICNEEWAYLTIKPIKI